MPGGHLSGDVTGVALSGGRVQGTKERTSLPAKVLLPLVLLSGGLVTVLGPHRTSQNPGILTAYWKNDVRLWCENSRSGRFSSFPFWLPLVEAMCTVVQNGRRDPSQLE